MAVYFLTGKLGAGKTAAAVGRMLDKLRAGLPVATNLDFYPENWTHPRNKRLRVWRLPDHPTSEDLENLGTGNATMDEERNGLIVLDELATWINSRGYADPRRKALIDWFLHARKKGWDVIFIVQHIEAVDKQLRLTLCEHLVTCRRLDRYSVPLLSPIFKMFTGRRLALPRIHLALVRYGSSEKDLIVDRWLVYLRDVKNLYDTRQCFSPNYASGLYMYLTPYHLVGRYLSREWSIRRLIFALFVITLCRFHSFIVGRPADEVFKNSYRRAFK